MDAYAVKTNEGNATNTSHKQIQKIAILEIEQKQSWITDFNLEENDTLKNMECIFLNENFDRLLKF